MSEFKINIVSRNDHNVISEKEYPKFEDNIKRLKAEGGVRASKDVRILFEADALKRLFKVIGWGSPYQSGDVEQAGMLIGNYYRDTSGTEELIWADVITVVPADSNLVNASFETIDITAEAWRRMYDDAAELRSENVQIVGWYHTHLAHINTRFSGLDRATQKRAFTYEYSFGVVFNPNQERWSAFYGPDSKECGGDLLMDEELNSLYGKPQITIKQVNGDSELQEDGSIVHFDENGRPLRRPEIVEVPAGTAIHDTSPSQYHEYYGQEPTSLLRNVGQFFSELVPWKRQDANSGRLNSNGSIDRRGGDSAPKIAIYGHRHEPAPSREPAQNREPVPSQEPAQNWELAQNREPARNWELAQQNREPVPSQEPARNWEPARNREFEQSRESRQRCKCCYYELSTKQNSCESYPHYTCSLQPDTVEKLAQHSLKARSNNDTDMQIGARVHVIDYRIELQILSDFHNANAVVMFETTKLLQKTAPLQFKQIKKKFPKKKSRIRFLVTVTSDSDSIVLNVYKNIDA